MSEMIEQCKQSAQKGKSQFLNTFAFVPDDKLTWSPSPTAKSALRVAAHVGVANHAFAGVLRGEKMPGTDFEELIERMNAAELGVTSREQAVQLIEESTAAVLVSLDSLTPEAVGSMVETPVVNAPMAFFMSLPGLHMSTHAAQVDYLQTIWGDLDMHMRM
ncbi:MAG: DinB family protein [Armatimonadetes bacterium]|nr:DinB family protein [Armatimonadota bacterium]